MVLSAIKLTRLQFLNPKGHQNFIAGSRVTANLLKKSGCFPIGQSGEACLLVCLFAQAAGADPYR